MELYGLLIQVGTSAAGIGALGAFLFKSRFITRAGFFIALAGCALIFAGMGMVWWKILSPHLL